MKKIQAYLSSLFFIFITKTDYIYCNSFVGLTLRDLFLLDSHYQDVMYIFIAFWPLANMGMCILVKLLIFLSLDLFLGMM